MARRQAALTSWERVAGYVLLAARCSQPAISVPVAESRTQRSVCRWSPRDGPTKNFGGDRSRASARQRPVRPDPFEPVAFGPDSGRRAVAGQHGQPVVQTDQAAQRLRHLLLGSAGEIGPAP